ncbi:hypothetical protein V1L52_03220 [Treponema sp. HNW]|uniref:hypothetical protein n=1 Tax=Treponema sp. HNW TaxID=3116654 RepID=UPI003D0EA588
MKAALKLQKTKNLVCVLLCCCAAHMYAQDYIYGITVDDSWYEQVKLSHIIEGIKDMPVKPTVRIVMSKNTDMEEYRFLFERIHEHAYVMACPVDSYEMKSYKNVRSYRKRFEKAYAYLAPYTDMWEIGNEVNGENWLGKNPQFIADKITAAYDVISGHGGKTVLTSYYTPPAVQKIEMTDWLTAYIPRKLKEGVDYLFVSYYEDDNGGFLPDWGKIFTELHILFPNSKLGIGECGNTAADATEKTKIQTVMRYYTMPDYTEHFVGGGFWWYWVQDCIPHKNNSVWKAINKCISENPHTKKCAQKN